MNEQILVEKETFEQMQLELMNAQGQIRLKDKQILRQGEIIKAVQRAVSGLAQPDH